MRSRKLWPLAVVLATGCAVAAGCSGFSSNDGPVAPPAEASTDAPASPDADADAGITADASTRFCKTGDATAALFCSDFDEGALTREWQVPITIGGRFEATPSDRSPPNALLTIVDTFTTIVPDDAGNPSPTDGGLGYSVASVTTTFGRGAAKGVSIELDMRIDELPTSDGGVVGVTFLTASFDRDDRSVALAYVQGRFYFVVRDPSMKDGVLSFPVNLPSTPRWFHVELRTAFDGSFASLSFDGIQVALSPMGVISSAIGIVLVVGSVATATTGMARAAYDNVIVHPL